MNHYERATKLHDMRDKITKSQVYFSCVSLLKSGATNADDPDANICLLRYVFPGDATVVVADGRRIASGFEKRKGRNSGDPILSHSPMGEKTDPFL